MQSGIVALFVLDEPMLAAERSGTRMKVAAKTRTAGADISDLARGRYYRQVPVLPIASFRANLDLNKPIIRWMTVEQKCLKSLSFDQEDSPCK